MNRDERRARWQEICREYRQGSERQRDFCRARGISTSTLQYWLSRTRGETAPAGKHDLVAVGVAASETIPKTLRIRADERITIEVDLPLEREQLSEILRAVAAL